MVLAEVGKDNATLFRWLKMLLAKGRAKVGTALNSPRFIPRLIPLCGISRCVEINAPRAQAQGRTSPKKEPSSLDKVLSSLKKKLSSLKDGVRGSGTSASITITSGGHVFIGFGEYTGAGSTSYSVRLGTLTQSNPTEDDIENFVGGVDITHEYAFNHVDTALVANVGLPLQASLEVGLTSDSEPGGSVSVNYARELPFTLGDLRQTPALGP